MAEVIRVDYEAVTKIASQFQNEAEAIQQILQMVQGAMTPLQNGGWIGQGSDAFFNEMESDILPAVGRLADALTQAGGVSRQISEIMQSAEEEAGSPFRASETGGTMFVPQDWLKNLGASPLAPGGNNTNDFGIPFNWLDGVAGDMGVGSGSNNWGIPENWLEGVTGSSNGGGRNHCCANGRQAQQVLAAGPRVALAAHQEAQPNRSQRQRVVLAAAKRNPQQIFVPHSDNKMRVLVRKRYSMAVRLLRKRRKGDCRISRSM